MLMLWALIADQRTEVLLSIAVAGIMLFLLLHSLVEYRRRCPPRRSDIRFQQLTLWRESWRVATRRVFLRHSEWVLFLVSLGLVMVIAVWWRSWMEAILASAGFGGFLYWIFRLRGVAIQTATSAAGMLGAFALLHTTYYGAWRGILALMGAPAVIGLAALGIFGMGWVIHRLWRRLVG